MKGRFVTEETVKAFREHLVWEERSDATIEKYIRDIRFFIDFVKKESINEEPVKREVTKERHDPVQKKQEWNDSEITKETVIAYKKHLQEKYAVRSINSMLAGLNNLFCFLGWQDLKVRALKLQQQVFCPEEKELTKAEYIRLCRTAEKRKDNRLNLILQTICATGIRVSELQYITVEAVKLGKAVVNCKGKTRSIFVVKDLKKKLLSYAAGQGIQSGMIFVTRSGKAIGRTRIWRDMKSLCEEADVNPQKVFPHNLRHLFARVFYSIEKDIAKLADILGHSSINTTRIYIISTGTQHQRRMENMQLIL